MSDAVANCLILAILFAIAYVVVKAVAALAALITWPALIAVVLVFVFLVVVAG